MNLYRVVVSFMKENMQFMAERGVLAMTPGQALDDTITHLGIDLTRIDSFKAWTQRPSALADFSEDAQFLACLGSKHSVRDVWFKRYGE
jgi:hypothetical protein